jgi:hypothetical protein
LANLCDHSPRRLPEARAAFGRREPSSELGIGLCRPLCLRGAGGGDRARRRDNARLPRRSALRGDHQTCGGCGRLRVLAFAPPANAVRRAQPQPPHAPPPARRPGARARLRRTGNRGSGRAGQPVPPLALLARRRAGRLARLARGGACGCPLRPREGRDLSTDGARLGCLDPAGPTCGDLVQARPRRGRGSDGRKEHRDRGRGACRADRVRSGTRCSGRLPAPGRLVAQRRRCSLRGRDVAGRAGLRVDLRDARPCVGSPEAG